MSVCLCIYGCMHVCVYVYVCLCLCVCVCLCVSVCDDMCGCCSSFSPLDFEEFIIARCPCRRRLCNWVCFPSLCSSLAPPFHTQPHSFTRTLTNTHTHTHTHTYTHPHTHSHWHTHTFTYTHTDTHTHIHIHTTTTPTLTSTFVYSRIGRSRVPPLHLPQQQLRAAF